MKYAKIAVLGQLLPRKISPLTPKLTLSQALTLTSGQFFPGAIAWLPKIAYRAYN